MGAPSVRPRPIAVGSTTRSTREPAIEAGRDSGGRINYPPSSGRELPKGTVAMRHIEEALTFDDVMLAPGYSETLPRDADLSTVLAPGVPLGIPIVSAAMDMVTEARLAIALAEEGGIGIVHRNMPPDVQADKVRRVKKFESGVVRDPITVAPDTTIGQVVELTRRRRISGVPVVDGKRLAGIVTARDLRFETRWNHPRPTGHDPGREAGHRPGGREPRRDHRAPARAPYREAARGQRERGAPRPHHE